MSFTLDTDTTPLNSKTFQKTKGRAKVGSFPKLTEEENHLGQQQFIPLLGQEQSLHVEIFFKSAQNLVFMLQLNLIFTNVLAFVKKKVVNVNADTQLLVQEENMEEVGLLKSIVIIKKRQWKKCYLSEE